MPFGTRTDVWLQRMVGGTSESLSEEYTVREVSGNDVIFSENCDICVCGTFMRERERERERVSE